MGKTGIFSLIFIVSSILGACSSGTTTNGEAITLPTITLAAINSLQLPALNQMAVAQYDGYWLIIGGSNKGIHDFSYDDFNLNIYVFNPATNQVFSESIGNTNIPLPVRQQITSLTPSFLQYKNYLYIVGGYYNNSIESSDYTTLQIITSYNIPGMIKAIINHDPDLNSYINYNTLEPAFKNAGGGLGVINDSYYLALGQDCEGFYCTVLRKYNNTVYKFATDPDLKSIVFESFIYRSESTLSGFRRRDFNLVPFKLRGKQTLLAMGGPFTSGSTALVWTNGIIFDANLNYNNSFINQQANQYKDAFLAINSQRNNYILDATFSGFSNLYWAESGIEYSALTPFGNILDLIKYDESNNTATEYINNQPVCSNQTLDNCLYMGVGAVFIPVNDSYYDTRQVLQLDRLSGQTLVGYLYGGFSSTQQNVFGNSDSYATNQAYAVYVTPGSVSGTWINVTNLESGTPYTQSGSL